MHTKDEIMQAIQNFFGDTSRTAQQTREALEEIAGELEILIESLSE